MKLRTFIVLAGLGAFATRKVVATRRREPLLLEPGPLPLPGRPAPEPALTEGWRPAPGVQPEDAEPKAWQIAEPVVTRPDSAAENGRPPSADPDDSDTQESAVPAEAESEAQAARVSPETENVAAVDSPADAPVAIEPEPEPEPEAEPAPEPVSMGRGEETAAAPPAEATEETTVGGSEKPDERPDVGPGVVDEGWPVPPDIAAAAPRQVESPASAPVEPVVLPPVINELAASGDPGQSGWSVVLYPEPGASEADAATGESAVDRPDTADEDVVAAALVEAIPLAAAPTPAPDAPTPPEAGGLVGAEVRSALLANRVPLVFVGATPLAMLGLERIVGRLSAVTVHDCFDGRHGGIYVPRGIVPRAYESITEIVNALLAEPEVVDRLRLRPGKIAVLAGDGETERLIAGFGHALALSPADLRQRLAQADELQRIAREADVRSLPAVNGYAASYQELLLLARGLGTDLLVESLDRPDAALVPIGSIEDWSAHQRRLSTEHLRVMRRLNGRQYTIAAVVTAAGVVVGPTIAETCRVPDLPPLGQGGVAASDVAAGLEEELRAELRSVAAAVGGQLRADGLLGLFEVDLTVERRTDTVTLTAIRTDGSLALVLDTVSAVAAGELPLLALHLAAYLETDLGREAPALSETWRASVRPPFSLFVLSEAADLPETITEAPASGIWLLDEGSHGGIRYVRSATDWRTIESQDEAFYLRIARAGAVRAYCGELGVVIFQGLAHDEGRLTERATRWARGLRKNVWTAPSPSGSPAAVPRSGDAVLV
jgi:hypothetical protein